MFDKVGALISGSLKAVSLAGKGLGKGQKLLKAWDVDVDKDGIPEREEAKQGAHKLVTKFKEETVPLFKTTKEQWLVHFATYRSIFMAEVFTPAKAVFEASRKAALEE